MEAAVRHVGPDQMLLDRLKLRIDDRAAVERADRECDLQRFDQKTHADGRPAGDDGEADPGLVQLANRALVALRQHLVLGQQGAVDIGNNERDAGHGATSSSWRTISFTIPSTDASIETVTGRSLACGGSSVLNWLSSSPGGMKCPLRAASRFAIRSLVPSRKTMRTSLRPCTRISR